MQNIHLLLPEILLSVLALGILMADLWLPRSRALYLFAALALALSFFSVLGVLNLHPFTLGTLWVADSVGMFFKIILLAGTLLTLLLSVDYSAISPRHLGLYLCLLLWATTGCMVLVSSVDLLLIFLSLELVSICSFILAGFERRDLKSSEGAIKYFLIGAFSSAITLYGISLFYGATGTTHLLKTVPSLNPFYVASLLFMTVGFGFKVSMVPFHLWVPDAYQGAPTPITAYLSVVPKVATLAVILRIFNVLIPHSSVHLTDLFVVLCALTMTVGNLTALFQDDVKRLLAYSSIAQAGYMLIGFVVGDSMGQEGALIYSIVYLFMNFGAFAVAIYVAENMKTYDISAYDGLAQRSLGLSLLMVLFLLSLAGIPPTAGFIGKFYIFGSAIRQGYVWLALIGALNSVISTYYYLRIAYRMFFVEPQTRSPLTPYWYAGAGLTLAGAATLAIGIFPNACIAFVQAYTRFLP